MNCFQCDAEYTAEPLKAFCGEDCYNNFWKNPFKVELSTICPTCKKEWARMVYPQECFSGQWLTICDSCGGKEEIVIELTTRYEGIKND